MPLLDLKKDLGWLLSVQRLSEEDETQETVVDHVPQSELYGEMRTLLENVPENTQFDTYQHFEEFYQSRFGAGQGNSFLLERAKLFFEQVEIVKDYGEDRAYYFNPTGLETHSLSGMLYVDSRPGPVSFYDVLVSGWEVGVDEYMHFFDHVPAESELNSFTVRYDDGEREQIDALAAKFVVDVEDIQALMDKWASFYSPEERFAVLAQFSGTWAELSTLLDHFSIEQFDYLMTQYSDDIQLTLRYVTVFSAEQILEFLDYGYFDFLSGLHRADVVAVLSRFSDREFIQERHAKFERYYASDRLTRQQDLAEKVCDWVNVPQITPDLLLAIVINESGGDTTAGGDTPYQGLMQISSTVYGLYIDTRPGLVRSRTNELTNLYCGASYLAESFENTNNRTKGLGVAIGNYNRGSGRMDEYFTSSKARLPLTTSEYLSSVLMYMTWFVSPDEFMN